LGFASLNPTYKEMAKVLPKKTRFSTTSVGEQTWYYLLG